MTISILNAIIYKRGELFIKYYIYKITNKINQKIYIGQTIDPERRYKEYFKYNTSHNSKIKDAIEQYGSKNFLFEVIDESDKNNIDALEIKYIQEYNSRDSQFGYNVAIGGRNGLGAGIDHYQSKLTAKQVSEIEVLIKEGILLFEEIGNKFDVNKSTISLINLGHHWASNKQNKYPLRFQSKHKLTLNKLNELKYDLKNTNKTYLELSKKYYLSSTTIKNINLGKQYINDNEQYPLRDKQTSSKLSFNEIKEIIYLLKTTSISMSKIASQFNVSSPTISRINSGKYNKMIEVDYPIR